MQCDQMWRFIGLWATFLKPQATINLPKSLTFLGNFCKGVKMSHFSSEIIFRQLLQTIRDFFSGHTGSIRLVICICAYHLGYKNNSRGSCIPVQSVYIKGQLEKVLPSFYDDLICLPIVVTKIEAIQKTLVGCRGVK